MDYFLPVAFAEEFQGAFRFRLYASPGYFTVLEYPVVWLYPERAEDLGECGGEILYVAAHAVGVVEAVSVGIIVSELVEGVVEFIQCFRCMVITYVRQPVLPPYPGLRITPFRPEERYPVVFTCLFVICAGPGIRRIFIDKSHHVRCMHCQQLVRQFHKVSVPCELLLGYEAVEEIRNLPGSQDERHLLGVDRGIHLDDVKRRVELVLQPFPLPCPILSEIVQEQHCLVVIMTGGIVFDVFPVY